MPNPNFDIAMAVARLAKPHYVQANVRTDRLVGTSGEMNRRSDTTFALGQVLATPGALAALVRAGVAAADLLRRHHGGDWGDLSPADAGANDQALDDGGRLFSSYQIAADVKVWVITEAADAGGSRSATTLLLPDEY